MMSAWSAFREGLVRSARYWQALVAFYITSLASALPFVFFPAINLAGSANRGSIRQAAQGIEAWMLIEALLARLYRASLGIEQAAAPEITSGLESILLFGLLAIAVAPLLAWIAGAFLSGGVLCTYLESPKPFQVRRFLGCCWRWFGPFLLLGLIQAILGFLLFIPVGIAVLLAISYRIWLAWLLVPLLLVLAILWLVLFEIAQVYAVSPGERNIWRAALDALRFLLRRPLALAGLYAMAFLLLILVHALFRLGVLAHLPLTWWPVALPAQQIFILVRLWTRGARLAGGAVLLRGKM